MTLLLRVELLKVRSTRLTYGLFATSAGLSALLAVLAATHAGQPGARALPPLSSAAGLETATTTTSTALLLAAVLGITLTAGEFRHGTIALTYLGFPGRGRVLAAKAAAAAVAGAFFGLAGSLASTAAGLAFLAAGGGPRRVGAGTLAGHIAGASLGAALLAAAGAALGTLLRSQLGAVTGILVWSLLAETAIGGLFTAARPYLPFTAATTLGGARLGEAALGLARTSPSGPGPLPFAATAALLLFVVVALSAVAARTTLRRDVSPRG